MQAPLRIERITVIVPCAGWPDTIGACLRSLAAQVVSLSVEVLVVVNGPGQDAAPESWPGVTILRLPDAGPAAARNAGVRASTGDVLAFTDADCVADPGWLAGAVAAMRVAAPDSVIAGAITRSGARANMVSLYDSVTFLRQEAYVRWSHALVTANLVVHRSVFQRVGDFDPAFNQAAFEDWDWSLRAGRAGMTIRYAPCAAIDHPCMCGFGQLKAKVTRLARGEIIFRRKYRRRAPRPALAVMIWDHARRAWGAERLSFRERVQVTAVGIVAAFWRWRASHRILRAGRHPRFTPRLR
jgi:GT2 family glycosyltransferase